MKEKFIQLFEEAQILIKKFNKKSYETGFQNQYEKYEKLIEEVDHKIEQAEQQDAVILEIASTIPDYAEGKLSAAATKRKAENIVMDYNYAMVTYVLPLINYNRRENCKKVSDEMVRLWNQKIAKTPIKNTTYEAIDGGFSQRLCYITTAVCESLGKPDDCHELQVLRNYRDGYLMSSEEGKQIVEKYYDIAPTIVKHIDQSAQAKEVYRNIYEEYLVPCIKLAEEEKMEECKEVYSNMVCELQQKYLYQM